MDTADFKILKAIADLKVPYPKADKIIVLNTTILSKDKKTAAKNDSHRTGDDRT